MQATTAITGFIVGALALALGAGGCDAGAQDGVEIGPRGGTVHSDDGRLTLEIPAGALTDTVAIRIVETDELPDDAAGPAYAIEPYGVTFAAPAELVYDLSDGLTASPDTVRLVTERSGTWGALADHQVDMETFEVSASVLFSANVGLVE